MKRLKTNFFSSSVICFLLYGFSIHGFAQDSLSKHSLSIALEGSNINYTEPIHSIETKGNMWGLSSKYYYKVLGKWGIGIDVKGSYGRLDYSTIIHETETECGFNNDVVSQKSYDVIVKMKNIKNILFESRIIIGRDFKLYSNTLRPFIGTGFRLLAYYAKGLKAEPITLLGYDRFARYLYVPIGITDEFKINNSWSIGASAEFDYFVRGWQLSKLIYLEDVENLQKKGFGIKAALMLSRQISTDCKVSISPFAEYWNINNSEIVQFPTIRIYEPQNYTTEAGCKLIIAF